MPGLIDQRFQQRLWRLALALRFRL